MTTMPASKAPSRRHRRIAGSIIALGLLWVLAQVWPTFYAIATSTSALGILTDYNGRIKSEPPSDLRIDPAGTALHKGDVIDFAQTPRTSITYLAPSVQYVRPGTTIPLVFSDAAGKTHAITIHAQSTPWATFDIWVEFARLAVTLLFLALAARIYWVKPELTTLGFLLYAIGVNPMFADLRFLPFETPLAWMLSSIAIDVLIAAGITGIVAFALGMDERDTNVRRIAYRALPYAFVAFAVVQAIPDVFTLWYGRNAGGVQWLTFVLEGLAIMAGLMFLLDAYRSNVRTRQRLSWVLFGYAVGVIANFVAQIILFSSISAPPWIGGTMVVANGLMPIALAYGILYHNLLGLRSAISRGFFVIGATLVVGFVFSLADKWTGGLLAKSRIGSVIPAHYAWLVSIVPGALVALVFTRMNKRVDAFVTGIAYRDRTEKVQHLDGQVETLHACETRDEVVAALWDAPVASLGLTGGVVYLAGEGKDADVLRLAGRSAEAVADPPARCEDALVSAARAERKPFNPATVPGASDGLSAYSLAVPMFSRTRLLGACLYGPHQTGEEIDAVESKALRDFVTAASAALVWIRGTSWREPLEKLDARVQALEPAPPVPPGPAVPPSADTNAAAS